MMKKSLIAGAAAAVAISGAGVAAAAAGGDDGQRAPAVHAKKAVNVIKCDGGRQKRVSNRMVNTPYIFGEGAKVAVPGARLLVIGPRHGRDTLSITFSAETNLSGSTDAAEIADWMELEVHVDGVPIEPYTAAGDEMSIAGPGGYDMHSAQFCTKIGPGRHRVQVFGNLSDGGNDDTLKGWLDDYVLRVEKSE